MCLMPDPGSAVIDPFFAETTLSLVCDVLEPTTGEPYNRDPRGMAKKAEGYAKASGVGDTIYSVRRPSYFIFDDVKYSATPYNTGFGWTGSSFRSTPTPTTKAAISATTSVSRRAISRCRRRTRCRICAGKCSAPWRAWA